MLNNITFGRYYHKNSLLHQMNPLVKIICTFLYVLIVILFKDLVFLILLLFFVILIMLMSKIVPIVYLKAVWSLKYFILVVLLLNLLIQPETLDVIFPVFRLILIILYSTLLTITTSPNQLAKGLEQFMAPLKILNVPVKQISLNLVHAIRFIPVVIDNVNDLIKAQRSRHVNAINQYPKRFQDAILIIIPCFTKSLKKAEMISLSMEQRLYSLSQDRTLSNVPKIKFFDLYFLSIHLIIFIAIIYRLVIG